MNKYLLHGHLKAQPRKGSDLAAILLKASELVSTAKGCHLYVIGQEAEQPDAVWITEIWDSKEDHDNSLQVPGVRELIGQAMPMLAGPPQGGQELTVLGGFGLSEG